MLIARNVRETIREGLSIHLGLDNIHKNITAPEDRTFTIESKSLDLSTFVFDTRRSVFKGTRFMNLLGIESGNAWVAYVTEETLRAGNYNISYVAKEDGLG